MLALSWKHLLSCHHWSESSSLMHTQAVPRQSFQLPEQNIFIPLCPTDASNSQREQNVKTSLAMQARHCSLSHHHLTLAAAS